MRYLRPVRIHESKKSDRKTLNKVKRYHAEFDAARSGEPGAARRARAAKARLRANTYGNDTAKIPFVRDSAISLGKQEAEKAKRLENSSITPLTLPNIMEGFKKPTRMPGTGPYMPQGDKIRMPANRKPMPKKKIKPGNVKNKKGGSQTTDEEDNITKWRS